MPAGVRQDEVAPSARAVQDSNDQVEHLQRGVGLAEQLVGAADRVRVSVVARRAVETDAATDDVVARR